MNKRTHKKAPEMGIIERIIGALKAYGSLLGRRVFTPIGKVGKASAVPTGIGATLFAACILIELVVAVFFSVVGLFLLGFSLEGLGLIALMLALTTWLTAFVMLGFAGEMLQWAILALLLGKALLYNSHLQLAKHLGRGLKNVLNWSKDQVQTFFKAIAAAVPGVSLAEMQNAFAGSQGTTAEKPPIDSVFAQAEKEINKMAAKAEQYRDTVKKAFTIWAVFLFDLILGVLLISFGHLSVPTLYWQSFAGISATIFLAFLIIWGLIYPQPEPTGLRKHFRIVGSMLFLLTLFEGAGYFLNINQPLSADRQNIATRNSLSAKQTNLETMRLEDRVWKLKVVAVTSHAGLDAKGEETATIIRAGTEWNLEDSSFFIGDDRFLKISNGYGSKKAAVYGDPDWFKVADNDSKTSQTAAKAQPSAFIYSVSQGLTPIASLLPGESVRVWAELPSGPYLWDGNDPDQSPELPFRCGLEGTPGITPLGWADKYPCDQNKNLVQAVPMPNTPFGALIVKAPGETWQCLGNRELTLSANQAGEVLININDVDKTNNSGSIRVFAERIGVSGST